VSQLLQQQQLQQGVVPDPQEGQPAGRHHQQGHEAAPAFEQQREQQAHASTAVPFTQVGRDIFSGTAAEWGLEKDILPMYHASHVKNGTSFCLLFD
jgi:hypothetical protein